MILNSVPVKLAESAAYTRASARRSRAEVRGCSLLRVDGKALLILIRVLSRAS